MPRAPSCANPASHWLASSRMAVNALVHAEHRRRRICDGMVAVGGSDSSRSSMSLSRAVQEPAKVQAARTRQVSTARPRGSPISVPAPPGPTYPRQPEAAARRRRPPRPPLAALPALSGARAPLWEHQAYDLGGIGSVRLKEHRTVGRVGGAKIRRDRPTAEWEAI